jgi:hypothetical protein
LGGLCKVQIYLVERKSEDVHVGLCNVQIDFAERKSEDVHVGLCNVQIDFVERKSEDVHVGLCNVQIDFVERKSEDGVLFRRRTIRLPVRYCECGSKLQVISMTFYYYKYSNIFSFGPQKLWFPESRQQSYRMNFSGLLAAICMVRTRVPSSALGFQDPGEILVSVVAAME